MAPTSPPSRLALALPAATVLAMLLVFPVCGAIFGKVAGYNVAFAIYWIGAAVVALALIGPRAALALLRPAPLPRPRLLAIALLAIPPIGGALVALFPQLRHADLLIVAVALGRASINALAEELLWRGVALVRLGGRGLVGWIYPALAFSAFHAAPLLVHGGLASAPGILFGSLWIGLGYGWIVGQSGSLRWPLIAHVATDAMGLAAARFVLGR